MKSLSVLMPTVLALSLGVSPLLAQQEGPPRVIDMHSHGALVFGEESVQSIAPWLEAFDGYNVEHVVLTAYPHQLAAWTREDPDRLIPSLMFPCAPGPKNYMQLVIRRCSMEGFIVIDYLHKAADAVKELSNWIDGGQLKHAEDIQEGIENTPKTFLRLFEGKNMGKQLLKIAEPPL